MKSETKLTSLDWPTAMRYRPRAGVGGLFVSPGYGQHPDRVIDSWELILVRSGDLHIEENGTEFRVGPGSTLLLPPGRRHRGLSEHPESLAFYWLHFTPTKQRLPALLRLGQHVRPSRPARLAELLHQYVGDQAAGILTPLAADALLLLMLSETTIDATPAGTRGAESLVRTAEEYVSHHLRHGIGPGDVARAIGYHTAHLSRLFRKVHGVTLGGYIRRVRVAQARLLLQDSALPLKQIARQCGFQDVNYFRRVFNGEVGTSPRAYRSSFGQVQINRD